jgi:23S rRNA pseudouridine1911/1915/1917 synthase
MPDTPQIARHIVPEEAVGMPLRDFAMLVTRGIPRKGVRKAIQRGKVRLDGQRVPSNHPVRPGQVVTIQLEMANPTVTVPDGMRVVFSDAHVAVIFKPAGVASGGKLRHYFEKLLSASPSLEGDSLRICRPVHRLDSATCGLVLAARTIAALKSLSTQFEQKAIEKRYVAVVCGQAPPVLLIDEPLDGKQAITRMVCDKQIQLPDGKYLSTVTLFPATGRTHQLRRHLALYGLPILGDRKYGRRVDNGLMLCALGLRFRHPAAQEDIHIETDPPARFGNFM